MQFLKSFNINSQLVRGYSLAANTSNQNALTAQKIDNHYIILNCFFK